ncbi:MAG: transcriptional regulator GcvA [Rhodospirillaceae bacterium]|nr:transcriptional regulator GcvA [Rhodospirillaceae bacterium]
MAPSSAVAAPTKRLPPLNSLRAFVAAARHLSFAKAAEELNVTPGAVSQQIKQLEDHLGCQLFRRTNRHLLLTDEGQACLPGLIESFDRMHEALDAIAQVGRDGRLTVSVAPSLAAKWLVPRLDRFTALHPEIDVLVSASMQLTDFEAESVDCAIRYGAGRYPHLVVEKLMAESVVPVCSPALLEGKTALRKPADLEHFTLLHDDSPDQDASCPDWRMWLRAAGVDQVDARRGLRFNQSSLVLEAALSSRGVALAKARLAADDLRAGRLVALFEAKQPLQFAYYFVAPPEKSALKRVQLFRDWLKDEVAREAI